MNGAKFLVICEETCPECKGAGVVSNELYQKLAEYRQAWKREHPGATVAGQLAADDEWMLEKGYLPAKWPAEEWECDECAGLGKRRRQVELKEALNELGKTSKPTGQ